MKVVGLDLSLTCTGVAVATQDGAVTDRITSKPVPNACLLDRVDRLTSLADRILPYVTGADLVVIEQPAYSRTGGSTHDRSGLWWLVVGKVARSRPIVEVTPTCRSRYATGRGNASKDDVLTAVIRRYPHIDVNGNDEADALILAAMGARHLGHPLEQTERVGFLPRGFLPQANLAAMDAVTWPEHLGGAA